MTASDLKYLYESSNPDGHFFTRDTMLFFGDTMRNYGVRKTVVFDKHTGIKQGEAYELYRRHPVKHDIQTSHFFDLNGNPIGGVTA